MDTQGRWFESIYPDQFLTLTEQLIPIFETENNRLEQKKASDKISKAWNVVSIELPPLSAVDFILHNPDTLQAKAVVEFKERNIRKDAYSTFFISEQKLIKGLDLADMCKVPLIVAVQWRDVLGWIKVTTLEGLEVRVGGRLDRGVKNDQERMVHFQTRSFKTI